MNREPASVRAARRESYLEQAYGYRASGRLDYRRIERLIELVDGVLKACPMQIRLPVRHTAAVRASLADAAIARQIAREAGREARKR